MKLSNKQQALYRNQKEEPIFTYYNPITGQYNFGYVRLGRSCVTITTSLRKLYKKGGIILTEETCELSMPTVPVSRGYVIEILGGVEGD